MQLNILCAAGRCNKKMQRGEIFNRGIAPWLFVRFRKIKLALDAGSSGIFDSDPC